MPISVAASRITITGASSGSSEDLSSSAALDRDDREPSVNMGLDTGATMPSRESIRSTSLPRASSSRSSLGAAAWSAPCLGNQSLTRCRRRENNVPLIDGRILGRIVAEGRSLYGYCIFILRFKRTRLFESLATKTCAGPTFRSVASCLLPSTGGAGLGCTVRPKRRHASCWT